MKKTIEKKSSKKFTLEKFTMAKLVNTKSIFGGNYNDTTGDATDDSILGTGN